MIQINIGDHSGNENGIPFTPIPIANRTAFRWARRKAIWIAANLATADRYYTSLSSGRSLTNLLADSSIWINYDPTLTVDGATFHNNDLWVGPPAIRKGRWQILATIVHELAHIGGAGGAATGLVCGGWTAPCHAAERAVLECGMGKRSELSSGNDDPNTPYNPGITG